MLYLHKICRNDFLAPLTAHVGGFTILTDEGLYLLAPLDLCFYAAEIHKEVYIAPENLGKPVTSYTFGGGKEGIEGVLLRESWEIWLRKMALEVPP